jgi:hypothetical protein
MTGRGQERGMIRFRNLGTFAVVSLGALRLAACSAHSTGDDANPVTGSGGDRAGSGATGSGARKGTGGRSSAGATGTGETGGTFHLKDASTTRLPPDASCGAVAEVPEQITKYIEASVTDTITTLTPVAIFIMQDRSSSMVTGSPAPASAMSWDNSATAISAFVKDAMSTGLDIGLGTFPYGPNNTADCSAGTDCGTPVVPIASLPGNAQPMIDAMVAQRPGKNANTPTECALRGMINTCLTYHATSPTAEKCVAVLVTDGNPTSCNQNQQGLTSIIVDGQMKGVDTYVLGLPGVNLSTLDAWAQAGGTGKAIDVSGGSTAFVAALNSIRGKVSRQESHTVVTKQVISTPLKCQWKIPQQKVGDPPLDPTKVNLQFTPPNGSGTQFGHVDSPGACPANQNAWYFDDEKHPTEIHLCPNACTNVEKVTGARIDILLQCPRIEAPPA